MDYAAIERDSHEHLRNPRPGDYWHEMYVPICVVLEVGTDVVTLCKSTKEVDSGHWTWNLGERAFIARSAFRRWLSYESIPDKTWCHVLPEQHLWAVDEFKRLAAKEEGRG